MDDFSERKNKELFEKVSEKQLKYAKKTMLLIFVLIGAIFLIMGLVLIACDIRDAENGVLVGIIFAPLGAFFILLGLTLRFAVPRTYNYENYKKRTKKGYYSTFDMEVAFIMQKERKAMSENIKKKLEKADITEEKK